MKKMILGAVALLFAMTVQAQNTNVTQTSKTTVTTIKDSEGEKQVVKEQKKTEAQDIKFKETAGDPLNKEMATTPTQVLETTSITNPDGSTRTVNVDRSAVYTSTSGNKYTLALDPMGYRVTSDQLKKPALLRSTSTNSYIYRSKDQTAVGYFDTEGNFVLETYDDKSDKVSIEKFTRVR
ncbi:hypothetical protein [Flavobacterium caeni]|uniref:YD repeat-containing protein n=1 Tax=Flavobacterium caeni TaxID=490189 RepID=A0A1G5IUP0_9FLAO|nr:hypothetical protein [Flavobacterium caeni]SCY79803.1 hypothetical protein SAMN02927903_02412 [Flavobacterium caeni]